MGLAFVVVSPAQHAAFVTDNQADDLAVGCQSCLSTEPQRLAIVVEDGADDVGIGAEVVGEHRVAMGPLPIMWAI